ncbi:MAG: hypothetical protein OXU51_19875 [Candidatus Poribacteria bacterium]|nr:hypothetical protein [Candidatus Poribacteria bacterium]
MTNSTLGVIIFAVMLAVAVVFMLDTAGAQPEVYYFTIHAYECLDALNNGATCTTGIVITITWDEPLLHKIFGDHPHGFNTFIGVGPMQIETALGCSECSFS